jgi:hypothetical protein
MLEQSASVKLDPFEQVGFLVVVSYKRDFFSLPNRAILVDLFNMLIQCSYFQASTTASEKDAYNDFPHKKFTAIEIACFKLLEGMYWLR